MGFSFLLLRRKHMEIENYPNNSNSMKNKEKNVSIEPKKKVEKIVSGTVKKKDAPISRKLADIFFSEDIKDVKTYVIWDVLVPSIKNDIRDVLINLVEAVFGKGVRKSNGPSSLYSYKSYDKVNDSRTTRPSQPTYSYSDIVLDSRGEAENVLSTMEDLIQSYGLVSIADLNEMVGIQGTYTDNKYGWATMQNAEIERVRDGYWLKLPKAMPLDV